MLRITVELIPLGQEHEAKKIGEMVVANTGKVSESSNLHSYEAWTEADHHSGEPRMFGRVVFDRSKSVWELVRLMLKAIRLEEHEPYTSEHSVSQRLLLKLGKGLKK